MYNTSQHEILPRNGGTTAWLFDKKIEAIVLHNLATGKTEKCKGDRVWRSCVTSTERGDRQ